MHICADSSESLSHVVMKLCPSPQFFNRAGPQTLIAGRKRRERVHTARFLRISKHNVWVKLQLLPMRTHARIQKVLSEGVQLCNSDNVLEERESKYHKIGPSSARQRNAI